MGDNRAVITRVFADRKEVGSDNCFISHLAICSSSSLYGKTKLVNDSISLMGIECLRSSRCARSSLDTYDAMYVSPCVLNKIV